MKCGESLLQWSWCHDKNRRETDTLGERPVKMGQRLESVSRNTENCRPPPELGERPGPDSSSDPSEGINLPTPLDLGSPEL